MDRIQINDWKEEMMLLNHSKGNDDNEEDFTILKSNKSSPLVKAGINAYSTGANETAISSTISK